VCSSDLVIPKVLTIHEFFIFIYNFLFIVEVKEIGQAAPIWLGS